MRAQWAKEAEWAGAGGAGTGRSGKRMEARMREFDFAASSDEEVEMCAKTVFAMMRREVRTPSPGARASAARAPLRFWHCQTVIPQVSVCLPLSRGRGVVRPGGRALLQPADVGAGVALRAQALQPFRFDRLGPLDQGAPPPPPPRSTARVATPSRRAPHDHHAA
eukprot:103546-Prymnesium_polylepis.1